MFFDMCQLLCTLYVYIYIHTYIFIYASSYTGINNPHSSPFTDDATRQPWRHWFPSRPIQSRPPLRNRALGARDPRDGRSSRVKQWFFGRKKKKNSVYGISYSKSWDWFMKKKTRTGTPHICYGKGKPHILWWKRNMVSGFGFPFQRWFIEIPGTNPRKPGWMSIRGMILQVWSSHNTIPYINSGG